MDDAEVIYEDENGQVKKLETGQRVPGESIKVDSVEIDEQGEWVLIHTSNSQGNEGSIILPRDRIYSIREGRL